MGYSASCTQAKEHDYLSEDVYRSYQRPVSSYDLVVKVSWIFGGKGSLTKRLNEWMTKLFVGERRLHRVSQKCSDLDHTFTLWPILSLWRSGPSQMLHCSGSFCKPQQSETCHDNQSSCYPTHFTHGAEITFYPYYR